MAEEALSDEQLLTQYVTMDDGELRATTEPRPGDQGGVSLIAERLEVAEVVALIRKHWPISNTDGVRFATVGSLRDAGFQVLRTPTKRNADHVSVSYMGIWDGIMAGYVRRVLRRNHMVRRSGGSG